MKTNLPSHIDKWSFNTHKVSFFEKYDIFIIIAVFTLLYFLIF